MRIRDAERSALEAQLARLGLTADAPPDPDRWRAFLDAVRDAYEAADRDLAEAGAQLRRGGDRIVSEAAAMMGDLDPGVTLQAIAGAVRRALGADRATCYVHEPGQETITAVYTTETDPVRRAFLDACVGASRDQMPVWDYLLDQSDPFLAVEDLAHEAQVAPGLAGIPGSGAFLGVRLEHPSIDVDGAPALLGTIFCSWTEPRRLTAADRADARALAALAALALANSRLHADALARLEENVALAAEQAALRREAERQKDEFFTLVSHELRTPLTSIKGYLEMLREGEGGEPLAPEERRAFLAVLERNAGRLERLVGDLLFVASLDEGRLPLDRGPVDLARVAEEAIAHAAPAAEARGVRLALHAEPVGPVRGDAGRLAQALDNLVSNAIKFTPDGGRVDVRVGRRGALAAIEVADTGVGIPAGEQRQLFERFFRAASATARQDQGIGLGLTVVKAIVDAHGGTVAVESEGGRGATFRIELPLDG